MWTPADFTVFGPYEIAALQHIRPLRASCRPPSHCTNSYPCGRHSFMRARSGVQRSCRYVGIGACSAPAVPLSCAAVLTLNSSVAALGQFADEETLLRAVCQAVVDGGYPMAMVAFADPDG